MADYLAGLEARLADVEPGDCLFPCEDTVVYLTGVSSVQTRAAGRRNLGVLAQPGNSVHLDHRYLFGADNGCFAKGDRFDLDGWLRWVEALCTPEMLQRLLFVVAPDVVGDPVATIARCERVLPIIQKLGAPAAFVGQDGLEDLEVPWDRFDVLFIGGSTEWKLSQAAADLVGEAVTRGKWAHVGRVNSWKRLARCREMGADSVDGTYLGFGPAKNFPKLTGWLDRLEREASTPRLRLVA